MTNNAVETHKLSHAFSKREYVLRNIHIQVPVGAIYGFLGPNGAGKTTTLRLITGLLKKQAGEISIFGMPFDKNRETLLRKLGVLIESPSVYGHLTAVENLALLQKVHQCPETRIPEVLHWVGLANTGRKKVSQFSLGMKQRLGIAIALLHSPSLLILDEPTNGLDPNGIIEMRALLAALNKEQGITIIISSHLLAEIEKTATHAGIIHQGEMMFQGTMDELKSKQKEAIHIVLDTNDLPGTMAVIHNNDITCTTTEGKVIIPAVSRQTIAAITQQLVGKGIAVYEVSPVKNDLEAIFISLINH